MNLMNKISEFGVFGTLKRMKSEVTGLKSSCIAHSYSLVTFVVLFNLIGAYILIIIAGIVPNFNLYVDTLKDFVLPLITGSITFGSIAITTCLGATYIDSKAPEEKKEEPQA